MRHTVLQLSYFICQLPKLNLKMSLLNPYSFLADVSGANSSSLLLCGGVAVTRYHVLTTSRCAELSLKGGGAPARLLPAQDTLQKKRKMADNITEKKRKQPNIFFSLSFFHSRRADFFTVFSPLFVLIFASKTMVLVRKNRVRLSKLLLKAD